MMCAVLLVRHVRDLGTHRILLLSCVVTEDCVMMGGFDVFRLLWHSSATRLRSSINTKG